METNRDERRTRAQKRVQELKGFYIHLIVYVLVNLAILAFSVMVRVNNGESVTEVFLSFFTYATPLFWGIGLAFHAAKTFGYSPFFSKDWEERQIQKYMEEDRREAEKYK